MFAKDPSFRIGCGRYLQGKGILKDAAEEIMRVGNAPVILSGETAWRVAGKALLSSLSAAGIRYSLEIYKGSCNIEAAELLAAQARKKKNGVIVGVGGGALMDLAKLVARIAALPIVNIPTSTATCAAYTPLSVCYTKDHRTVGTVHHKNEVNAVLVDTEILIAQPPRLFLAGVFDAQAKLLEIRHGYRPTDTSFSLGLDYAYALAERSYAFLESNTRASLQAMERGEVSEVFEQAVFTLIAATGVISGIARGSSQTALGHKFYEIARALYPESTRPYLHGELVGIGLLLQNEYNGEPERNRELLSFMQAYDLPSTPAAADIATGEESLEAFFERIVTNKKMKDINGTRLRAALRAIWRN